VQNSPPGSASLAMSARLQDYSQQRLDEAIAQDKDLLQTWCMRGAPYIVPTALAAVFTAGVLPPSEVSMRHFLPGLVPAVDELGMSVAQTVELLRGEIGEVLTGRELTIEELGAHLAPRISGRLSAAQRGTWQRQGVQSADQTVGEAVVHFAIRILTLQGVVCLAPRDGRRAPFVLVDEWLGTAIPTADPRAARAELLRRYLHCYGPSTRADFAAWLGVRVSDLDPWWSEVRAEMVPVHFGHPAFVLADDLERLQGASMPRGVRLLPPHDPYTQARDRHTIVDQKHRTEVWGPVGDPGVILLDGRIVGTWRAHKARRTLTMMVSAFHPLSAPDRHRIGIEAEQVGVVRGASIVDVRFRHP